MRTVSSPASAARSIFDFATSGLRLRTLSSVAPTNMPVPARADPTVADVTRSASNATLRTRGEYSVGKRTVGPNKHLDEFAVGGRDPARPEPLRYRIRRPARSRREGRQLAATPRLVVVDRRGGVAAETEQRRWVAIDLGGDGAGDRGDVVVRPDAHELLRHERLLPRVLEQLRELERLPVGSDLRCDRRPHAGRNRLRGKGDRAAFDVSRDQARLDAERRDPGTRYRTYVVPVCELPSPRAAHLSAPSYASGASATAARIAPRSRSPSQSSLVPAITFSTSSRFDSSSWSMRSSSVPDVISECTHTGFSWPRRCARSDACCSTAGFHQRSKWKTWFAAGRFSPRPPARSETTSTEGPPGEANAVSSSSRCDAFSDPWKKSTLVSRRSARCSTSPAKLVYCVNTSALSF